MRFHMGFASTARCAAVWLVAGCTLAAQAQGDAEVDALVARVVADLPDSLVTQHSRAVSLRERMASAGVPAVSLAVFRDGRLAWARAWGVRDSVQGGHVDERTLFQAASISKPISAMGAVRLAHERKLDLDADIGSSIDGWNAGVALTPRQLMSHSAGLGVSGFPGYAQGQPVPSVLQILNGQPPSRTQAVRVEGPVGGPVRYSGGGYTVLQAVMSARSGMSFEAWMQKAVLAPLGMRDSSFDAPSSTDLGSRAASGHRRGQPVAGRWHLYPESAAAGLWTTPTDLGRAAAALQDQLAGRPAAVLEPGMAQQMLTPQAGGFGLGWVLETRSGEALFGHNGLNEGFEAVLAASASSQGPQHLVVVMTNGQGGTLLAQALLRAVAREVGWRAHSPRRVLAVDMSASALRSFEGYFAGARQQVAVEVSEGVAHLRDGGWQRARLVPISSDRFAVENRSFDLVFGEATADGVRNVRLEGEGSPVSLQGHRGPLLSDAAPPVLRGSHTAWKTEQAFLKTAEGEWALSLPLKAGEFQFKLFAGPGARLSLGARLASSLLTQGRPEQLAPVGGNLRLQLERDGTCEFVASSMERDASIRVECR
jgi:CubicO group peptidase (beta-lactamase class C family)